MEVHWPLLSVLIWLPILGGLLTLAFGDARAAQGKWFALLVALATLVLSQLLFPGHDTSSAAMRFVENVPWVPSFDIRWHLGVDGISIALIALALGVYPRPLTDLMEAPIAQLLGQLAMTKL